MQVYRFDRFGGLAALTLHEEDCRHPERGELLLRSRAVSLDYRDIAMVLGSYPAASEPGHIPTSDAAADIVSIGEGVTGFKPGNRVIGAFHPRWFGGEAPATLSSDAYGAAQDGWLSEYKVVSQQAVVTLPDALSFEEGATLPCAAATAWCALSGANPIRAGHTVLTLRVPAASRSSPCSSPRLSAPASSRPRRARRRRTGFARSAPTRSSITARWPIGASGRDDGWSRSRSHDRGGRPGHHQAVAEGGDDGRGGRADRLPQLRRCRPRLFRSSRHLCQHNLVGVVRAVDACGLKPVIDRVFDFADAKAAFQHLEAGRHIGKIVIRVGG